MGEVFLPGSFQVSGLSDLIHILSLSGGIKKTGSLRNILIINENGTHEIDLYDFIYKNKSISSIKNTITDETVILVPPIGSTIAITGNSIRPGIFEIKEEESLLIQELIKFSGGILRPGPYKVDRQGVNSKGIESFEGAISQNAILQSGDIIYVNSDNIIKKGFVKLIGGVKVPSLFSIKEFSKISEIIEINTLHKDAYKFAFVIKTYNKDRLKNEYKVYNLWNILKKKMI